MSDTPREIPLETQEMVRDDDQIISEILANAQEIKSHKYTEVAKEFKLTYGNKRLTVTRCKDNTGFQTYIKNIYNDEKRKAIANKPRQTTLLFEAAKKIMEREVVEAKCGPQIYWMQTLNPQMRAWAEDDGNRIFCWQSRETKDIEGDMWYRYKTTINSEEEK